MSTHRFGHQKTNNDRKGTMQCTMWEELEKRIRNWIVGELDLIVLDQRVVVFVEVKTRTGHGFGSPFEAVEFRKQRKMIQAAQYFLAEKKLQQRDARFDVVGISWPGRDPMVEHIENAFELS